MRNRPKKPIRYRWDREKIRRKNNNSLPGGELITETIASQDNEQGIDVYDVGSRHLKDEQIEHLRHTLEPIYGLHDPKSSFITAVSTKLAELLKSEDINYESALNLFANLKADVDLLKDTYTQKEIEPDRISFLDILCYDLDKKEARNLEKQVMKVIKRVAHDGVIVGSMGTNKNCIIDPLRKKTFFEKITYNRKGEPQSDLTEVVDACLKKLTVYDNPIAEEPRKWKSVWVSNVVNDVKIAPCLMDEMISFLADTGCISSKRHGTDVITKAANTFIKEGMAELKTEIETPGFYYNAETNEILVVKYELKDPSQEDLKKALKTLKDLADWYPGHQSKLVTTFKWGLTAPFHFAMKQRGTDVQWEFLYGRGGSGKSTMGKMVLFLWGEPHDKNYIGGSGFNTEYRIGEKISQSTFPIVVDEPGAIFEKINTRDMIKTAVQQPMSRGKNINGRYRNIPAYASVIITSNQPFPASGDDQEALFRRFLSESFGYSEKKTADEIEAFDKEFSIKNTENCRLHELKPLGQFAANEIINDPDLLDLGWRKLADTLILRIFMELGKDVPEWLKSWSEEESLDEFNDIQLERIRAFLQKQINDAYGRIQVLDEEGRPKQYFEDDNGSIKTTNDFKERVRVVLNERKIEWAWLNKNDRVILTYGFIEALHKGTCIKDSMKNLAELLDWKLQESKNSERKTIKSITVSRQEFTAFVFPTCDFEGCMT